MGMLKTPTALPFTVKDEVLFLNVKQNVILIKCIQALVVRYLSVYFMGYFTLQCTLWLSSRYFNSYNCSSRNFLFCSYSIHQRKTFWLSTIWWFWYPSVFEGYVTALECSSCVYQKMAASYGIICHSFLDAVTMYIECYRAQTQF
jgi:hypothetical protein